MNVEIPVRERPIDGARYWSKDFADREWDAMWTKVWLVAGLERDLPEPGDFITTEIGRESILLARGEDGAIRAFYNVCQHRGNRLVEAEEGTLSSFTCAYHAWCYDLEGTLVTAPDADDFPGGSPCGKVNLEPVRCEVFAGFVWFSLDSAIVPLREFLGEIAEHIEGYHLERMSRTHWVTVEGQFNWKCVQDNFNESYHLEFVHPQTRFIMETRGTQHGQTMYPTGHARIVVEGGRPDPRFEADETRVASGLGEDLAFWGLKLEDFDNRQDLRAALQGQRRELGAAKGYDYSGFSDEQLTDHIHYTIFPNLSLSLKPDGCIFLRANPHPSDPEKTIFDMWYFTLFPAGATSYYSNAMKDHVAVDAPVPHVTGVWPEVSCGPVIDQDVRIWNAQQKGFHSRGYRGGHYARQERRVRFFHDNLDRYIAEASNPPTAPSASSRSKV